MSQRFVTVPLTHDESAFPIGTISYSQFSLSDLSYGAEYKTVRLNDDRYVKSPMVMSDAVRTEESAK